MLFSLPPSGIVDYHTALELTTYLSDETSYIPWTAALSSLDYLESMFTRMSGYGPLKVRDFVDARDFMRVNEGTLPYFGE